MKQSLKNGIIAGLIFGILDVVPMFFIDGLDDRYSAITGAFINRFAIGLFIFTVDFPVKGWVKGLIIGLLLSLPDAIITKVYGPILGVGIIGGIIIGFIQQRIEKK